MRNAILVIFAFLLVFIISCKGKDEPIPAYVHIDSISLNTKPTQGNPIHKIEFIYAYIDGVLLGVFELPANIPVLRSGKHTFTATPAVALNGSSSQLAIHTGFLPTDTTLDLTSGKITTCSNLIFQFRANSEFVWIEDFEDNSSTLVSVSMPKDDTAYIKSAPYELDGRFAGSSKVYSIEIINSDTNKYIDIGSFKAFNNLPNYATDVFMEFDLLCDVPVQLALQRTNSQGSKYVPYLYMYSTEKKWKHFYVNLNYETSGQEAGTTYKILFSTDIGAGSGAKNIQLDNIRLSFTK